MNPEQLSSARLARWSQNGEARLTLEWAGEWLNGIGFCRYLPVPAGNPPSASFLEAVVGRPAPVPSAGERSRANDLLARLIATGAAVPLKLGASVAEEPDFIVSPETFRYIYALRGNRNFKGAPPIVGNDKVTPLALHCWQAVEAQGPLDASSLQPILGQDITQAAILRALHELWTGLYAFPIPAADGPLAQWDLLPRRFPKSAAAGVATGRAEAQSAMVSLYLHAAVAAPEEDVLAALASFAPQSKLREVIRGLGSMRQLDIVDIGGRAHVCLQGGLLPEMVAHLSEEQLANPAFESGLAEPASEKAIGFLSASRGPAISQTLESARASRPRSSQDRKGLIPKKFVSRQSEDRLRSRPEFTEDRGKTESRSFRDHGSREQNRDWPRPHAQGPASRDSDKRPNRWQKTGERPGFRTAGFKPESRPVKPWQSKNADRGPAGAKPWARRESSAGNAPRSDEGRQDRRPAQWKKPREQGSGFGGRK